jgi:hypothetical protein
MNKNKEMKRSVIYFSILIVFLLVAQSCRTSKRSSYQVKNDTEIKASSSEIILDPPVNTADKKELSRSVYSDQSYYILQKGDIKFKDNSPFIEYLDGGKRERLWFASSRADSVFFGHKRTNSYQQIYYCERNVDEGKTPKEGWGDVKMLIVESDNPFYDEFIKKFNISTKGAVSIADNTMLFSCDIIDENGISEFKDIWELKREGTSLKIQDLLLNYPDRKQGNRNPHCLPMVSICFSFQTGRLKRTGIQSTLMKLVTTLVYSIVILKTGNG